MNEKKQSNEKLSDRNLEIMWEHAWKYFEFHGNQRITLIRFFVAFITLYLTGVALLSRGFHCFGKSYEIFALIISLSFIVGTYIFQQLDLRNRELIKLSENSLVEIENNIEGAPDSARIFRKEKDTDSAYIGHTAAYRYIFQFSYLLSIIFIIWASWSYCAGRDNCTIDMVEIKMVDEFDSVITPHIAN